MWRSFHYGMAVEVLSDHSMEELYGIKSRSPKC